MKITWKRRTDMSYNSYHAYVKILKQQIDIGFITQYDPEADPSVAGKWITSTSRRRGEFYASAKEAKKAFIRELKKKKYMTLKIQLF